MTTSQLTTPEERAEKSFSEYWLSANEGTIPKLMTQEIRATLKEIVEVAESLGGSLHTAPMMLELMKKLVNEVLPEGEKIK